MSTIVTGIRIWIGTLVLNAILFGIISLIAMDTYMLLMSAFLVVSSFIIGMPFFVLMLVLLKIANLFPYGATGKMCWVAVITSVCVVVFYMGVNYLLNNSFSLGVSTIQTLTGTTIAALLISVYFNRRAFGAATSSETLVNLPTDTK